MRPHLAQAQFHRAPQGRKSDFGDAKRLLQRFVAGESLLSFVPVAEQRAWRMVARGPLQLVRERTHLQKRHLDRVELVDRQIGESNKRAAAAIHPKAVQRYIHRHLNALPRLGYRIPAAAATVITLER